MANPPRPPPDNTQIVTFVRAEYARRAAPEEAYRNVCEVIRYMQEHNPEQVLDLARVQQQPAEQPRSAPAPEPKDEEPKPDDSEKVEPEKEPERDLKRATHSPINISDPKKAKIEEQDPQEGTSSQFHPPLPPPEPAGSREMDIEDEDEANILDPKIGAGDRTMELVEEALQQPQIHREEPRAQQARKSEKPTSGDDGHFSRSPPLAEELARAEDVLAPHEKPKTPEHDPQEGTSSQYHGPPASDYSAADESVNRQPANVSNWEGAGHFGNVLRQNQEDDEDWESSVGTEEYPDSDVDSDDYEVDELDELDDDDDMLEEYILPFDDFSLDIVKEVYRVLARREFKAVIEFPLGVADISRILHLRRFTNIKLINLPIDTVEVTIGYRYIIFDIRHAPSGTYNTIQYVSHKEGCRFEHSNISMVVKGVKYQTLAAKDFFYLVRHPNLRLKKLIISIVDYETPRIYPFQSFFWKISNYFESSDSLQLKVCLFSITTFYYLNGGDRARDFIEIFWSKLSPEELKTAIFRVWDDEFVRYRLVFGTPPDRNLSKNLYNTEQWRNLKKLDIYDVNIVINPEEYTHFTHFDEYRVFLPIADTDYLHFREISVAFGALDALEHKVKRIVVVPDHFSVREAFEMFLRNRYVLDIRKIYWSERNKVFLALLRNGASLQVSGPWKRDNHTVKLLIFTLPLKPAILKAILAAQDKKKKEEWALNMDTLPGRPAKTL